MLRFTLACPLGRKPYAWEAWLAAFARLRLPKADMALLWLDLSGDATHAAALEAAFARERSGWARARLLTGAAAGKRLPMFIARGAGTSVRYASMAETFNILNRLREPGTDLLILEDDILPPPDGFEKLAAAWRTETDIWMLAGCQYDREPVDRILAWWFTERPLIPAAKNLKVMVREGRMPRYAEEKVDGLEYVDGTATGFCLVRGKFLDGYKFRHQADWAQDVCACADVRAADGLVALHWGVKCGHVDAKGKVWRNAGPYLLPTAGVAIVVSTWAGYRQWLRESVESVDAQSPVAPAQKILVCDGVEPPTWLGTDWKVIRRQDGCAAPGRNAALAATEEPWVIFLDGDDTLAPAYLYQFARRKIPAQVGFCYPDMALCDVDMKPSGQNWVMPDWDDADVAVRNVAGSPAVWRRSALESIGGWPHHKVLEDWGAVMRCIAQGWRGLHLPHVLVNYRRHGTGKSANGARAETSWQVSRFSAATLLCGDTILLQGWGNYLMTCELPPKIRLTILVDTDDQAFLDNVFLWHSRLLERFVAVTLLRRPATVPAIDGKYAPHYRVTQLYARVLPGVAADTDFVWLLEDDIRPPLLALRTLHDDGFPHAERNGICAAVYPARGCPERITGTRSLYRWKPDLWWSEIEPGLHPIAMMPGGCSLYRGSALRQALPAHWRWASKTAAQGWDMAICRNMRDAGWTVNYHGSVKCEHHVKDYETGIIHNLVPPSDTGAQ